MTQLRPSAITETISPGRRKQVFPPFLHHGEAVLARHPLEPVLDVLPGGLSQDVDEGLPLGQFQLSHGVGDVKALDFWPRLPQLPGDGTPLLGLEAIAQLMAK